MSDNRIVASGGGTFDCYVSLLESGPGPALVIMSAVFGVNEDVHRARERAADRENWIERGMQDLADVMAELRHLPECNGRIAVVGLCYSGPYAILGPARLGCDAGFAFHGTAVENYLDALSDIGDTPIWLHWGIRIVSDHPTPWPASALLPTTWQMSRSPSTPALFTAIPHRQTPNRGMGRRRKIPGQARSPHAMGCATRRGRRNYKRDPALPALRVEAITNFMSVSWKPRFRRWFP